MGIMSERPEDVKFREMMKEVKHLMDYKEKTGKDMLLRRLRERASSELNKNNDKSGFKIELSGEYNQMIKAMEKLKKNTMDLEEYYYWAKKLNLLK